MNKIAYEYGQRIAMEKMAGFLNVLKPGFEFLGKAFTKQPYTAAGRNLSFIRKDLGAGFKAMGRASGFGNKINAFANNMNRMPQFMGNIAKQMAPTAAVAGIGAGGLYGLNRLMAPEQEPTIQQQLMRYMPGMR